MFPDLSARYLALVKEMNEAREWDRVVLIELIRRKKERKKAGRQQFLCCMQIRKAKQITVSRSLSYSIIK